ncbi:hypothetical protein J7I85_17080, partial [Arthrobacter sp. ISL-65]|nr:hypothetical protein [Arthrobacter sp. ISL-65]
MTTSQNRQPKGITTGGQFTPDTHAESTLLLDPATRDITLSPGESKSFQDLADGDIIETLNVNRSDDGSGYWTSPAQTVNIKDLVSAPRLHGQTAESARSRGQATEGCLVDRERRGVPNPFVSQLALGTRTDSPERKIGKTSSHGTSSQTATPH